MPLITKLNSYIVSDSIGLRVGPTAGSKRKHIDASAATTISDRPDKPAKKLKASPPGDSGSMLEEIDKMLKAASKNAAAQAVNVTNAVKNKKFQAAGLDVRKCPKKTADDDGDRVQTKRRPRRETRRKQLRCHCCRSKDQLLAECPESPKYKSEKQTSALRTGRNVVFASESNEDDASEGDNYSHVSSFSTSLYEVPSTCTIIVPHPSQSSYYHDPTCNDGGAVHKRTSTSLSTTHQVGAAQVVVDTGNDRAVTNDEQHVMRFTGHQVNLTGSHGQALPMRGAKCAFPTVDVDGKARSILCLGIGAYAKLVHHVLLPIARLMEVGYELHFRIPMNAEDDGYSEYEDYGGCVVCPDGMKVVMIFD
jgi:hypothetical protein